MDGWPQFPLVTSGDVFVPLAHEPLTEAQCPEWQRILVRESPEDSPQMARLYGCLAFPIEEWLTREQWEVVAEEVGRRAPWEAPDRVQYVDLTCCYEVDPAVLSTDGWSVEMARWIVPRQHMGVLERIGTYVLAEALDDDGIVIASYHLDGTVPCVFPLAHPDPTVSSLSIRWRVTQESYPQDLPQPRWVGPEPPTACLRTDWADMRYGWRDGWPQGLRYPLGTSVVIRLFATLYADPDSWRIRLAGRLAGCQQMATVRGQALTMATAPI